MSTCDACSEKNGGDDDSSLSPGFIGGCRVLQEFRLLHDVSATLAQGLDLRDAVQPLFRKLAETTALRRGLLTIVNRESGELMVEEMQDRPHADHNDRSLREKLTEGYLGRVATIGEPLVLANLAQVPVEEWSGLENRLFAEARSAGEGLVAVPIVRNHSQPLTMIWLMLASVLTLLTTVGLPHTPQVTV